MEIEIDSNVLPTIKSIFDGWLLTRVLNTKGIDKSVSDRTKIEDR